MSSAAVFRIGDKVVYPNHGVGVIEHITHGAGGGATQDFYLLKIEASNLRVMVPLANVASVGLRALADERDWRTILAFLETGEVAAAPADWKWRFKENSEKMRTGAPLPVAEVLKSLVRLHHQKPLSFREKKMLDHAAALLAEELASARNLDPEAALALLRSALAKAALELPPAETATN